MINAILKQNSFVTYLIQVLNTKNFASIFKSLHYYYYDKITFITSTNVNMYVLFKKIDTDNDTYISAYL